MAIEESTLPTATKSIAPRRESTARDQTLFPVTPCDEIHDYNFRILIVPFLSRYNGDAVRRIMAPSKLSQEELETFKPSEPWYQ